MYFEYKSAQQPILEELKSLSHSALVDTYNKLQQKVDDEFQASSEHIYYIMSRDWIDKWKKDEGVQNFNDDIIDSKKQLLKDISESRLRVVDFEIMQIFKHKYNGTIIELSAQRFPDKTKFIDYEPKEVFKLFRLILRFVINLILIRSSLQKSKHSPSTVCSLVNIQIFLN